MKGISSLIKLLGYALALLIFLVLLIEIFSLTSDLGQGNFKAKIANIECIPENDGLKFNIEVSYNGQRVLKNFKAFLKIKNITLKSHSINLGHNETANLTIKVPLEYLGNVIYGNSSLLLGFEFNYDGIIPLKIAFRDFKDAYGIKIEPLKVGYTAYNSECSVTMNATIINYLPLEIHGKVVFTVLNYSKTSNITLMPCNTTVLNLPLVNVPKEDLEKGVAFSINLLVKGKVVSSRTIIIKI